jgi:hypothetical protein
MSREIVIDMKIRQVSLAISVAILLLFGLFARGGNVTADKALTSRVPCATKIWNNTIYSQDSSRICPDVMDYQIRATAVDEQSGNFILRLIPKPRGMYGVQCRVPGWLAELSQWITIQIIPRE